MTCLDLWRWLLTVTFTRVKLLIILSGVIVDDEVGEETGTTGPGGEWKQSPIVCRAAFPIKMLFSLGQT